MVEAFRIGLNPELRGISRGQDQNVLLPTTVAEVLRNVGKLVILAHPGMHQFPATAGQKGEDPFLRLSVHQASPTIARHSSSLRMATPSSAALRALEPASAPTIT